MTNITNIGRISIIIGLTLSSAVFADNPTVLQQYNINLCFKNVSPINTVASIYLPFEFYNSLTPTGQDNCQEVKYTTSPANSPIPNLGSITMPSGYKVMYQSTTVPSSPSPVSYAAVTLPIPNNIANNSLSFSPKSIQADPQNRTIWIGSKTLWIEASNGKPETQTSSSSGLKLIDLGGVIVDPAIAPSIKLYLQ
jgi:hypothetical protein